jgi:hypothetical protein
MTVRRTKEGALTERVARALLGAPSGVDPEKGQVRFGEISVNIATGRYFDYEDETGGSHIELIQRFKNVQNGQAEAWLRDNVIEARPLPLPAEYASERALIGMLAMRPDLMAAVEEDVTVDNFGEPIHKQMFEAIAACEQSGQPVSFMALINAAGGDLLMPVFEGYTLGQYAAMLVSEAPMAPDAAHLARTLAAQIRSQANRDGDVDDEFDLEAEPAPFVSQFGGIAFEQLDEPGPEHAHVIDGLITVGDKSVLGGASQSGKSFLAIHMAMCIGTAMSFFGRKILAPGLVIYQAGEGGRGIKKRFRAWRQHFGVPKDKRVPVYILQSKVDIHSHEGDTARLIDEIKGIERMYGMPVVALFIDTLQKAQGMADENSGRDMGVVMANVDRIAAAVPGCHVCLVHHMNAGGTKLRGHTSVYAGVDQVILVTKDPETRAAHRAPRQTEGRGRRRQDRLRADGRRDRQARHRRQADHLLRHAAGGRPARDARCRHRQGPHRQSVDPAEEHHHRAQERAGRAWRDDADHAEAAALDHHRGRLQMVGAILQGDRR